MPGRFRVGRFACGLFMVALLLLQQFGWCIVVLAASWSACSSLGLFCCCQRCRVLGSVWSFVRSPPQPVLVSRRGLGLVVAGMSDAGFFVLQPGRSRRFVFVRRRRSRTRSTCGGLRCFPHWFPPAMRSSCTGVWSSCYRQRYARPVLLLWRRVRRLMASLSYCRVCWAIGGWLRLCAGARTPYWFGVLRWCVAPLMVGLCCVAPRCGVLCGVGMCCVVVWWCVAPLMVGLAALVCGSSHGGACGVGVRCVVLCGAVCCGGVWPPLDGACCVGVWPPSWWGYVLLCCVAPRCGAL